MAVPVLVWDPKFRQFIQKERPMMGQGNLTWTWPVAAAQQAGMPGGKMQGAESRLCSRSVFWGSWSATE